MQMSEDIPLGPIIGTAIGLGLLAGAVKVTKDILESSKEEKEKQSRKRVVAKPITSNNDMDRVERGLNKMLYGGRQ